MIDALSRLLQPLRRRLSMMVARGIVELVADGKNIQQLQATFLADEVIDQIEHIQHFGFTSVPLTGAQVVAVFLSGNRDHGVVIASDDGRHRPKDLSGGESAVYSSGKYQVRVRGGKIELGKDGTWETVVMGETLSTLLGLIITDLAEHTHPGPGSPPTTAATIAGRKTSYVDNGKILAKDGGAF